MTTSESRPGGTGEAFTELVAAPFLERGQNFYTQPPFDDAISGRTHRPDLYAPAYRVGLTRLAKFLERIRDGQDDMEADNPIVPLDQALGYIYSSMREIGTDRAGAFRRRLGTLPDKTSFTRSMLDLYRALGEFPWWDSYIVSQLQVGIYRANGDFGTNNAYAREQLPSPTYANWITEKLPRQRRLISYGVGDVFPEGLPTGRRVRKWHILKTAELVRKRR